MQRLCIVVLQELRTVVLRVAENRRVPVALQRVVAERRRTEVIRVILVERRVQLVVRRGISQMLLDTVVLQCPK